MAAILATTTTGPETGREKPTMPAARATAHRMATLLKTSEARKGRASDTGGYPPVVAP
jgi:H+/Cl- antiporter ClcA